MGPADAGDVALATLSLDAVCGLGFAARCCCCLGKVRHWRCRAHFVRRCSGARSRTGCAASKLGASICSTGSGACADAPPSQSASTRPYPRPAAPVASPPLMSPSLEDSFSRRRLKSASASSSKRFVGAENDPERCAILTQRKCDSERSLARHRDNEKNNSLQACSWIIRAQQAPVYR